MSAPPRRSVSPLPCPLPGRFVETPVFHYELLDSTQREARRLFAQGSPECVVVSRQQTDGHGRRGRYWWSLPGRSLLFSLLINQPGPGLEPQRLTILLAEAAVATLEEHGVHAYIKWPNDIMLEGLKCGGVIAEEASESGGRSALVLGMGLNLHYSPDELPPELQGIAIAPFGENPPDSTVLLARILGHFTALAGRALGPGPFFT